LDNISILTYICSPYKYSVKIHLNMSITKNFIKELPNGNLPTVGFWRVLVADFLEKKPKVSISELRTVDSDYYLAKEKDLWYNVQRGRGGYEATRRAALALAKLHNVSIDLK
jgi:hypothetical protein